MAEISEKHKALIDGLSRIYECLTSLTFIQPSDIIYPPHNTHKFDIPRLESFGFSDEVIALIQQLPYLTDRLVWPTNGLKGTFIAPETKALSYLNEATRHHMGDPWTNPRRRQYWKEMEEKLDSWMLRVTDGDRYGSHYIYDTKDQTMTRWCEDTTLRDHIPWHQLSWRPANVVLTKWLQRLETLEWIPLTIATRVRGEEPAISGTTWYLTNPQACESLRDTEQEWSIPKLKDQANLYRIVQKLYADAGWPVGFRREAFEYSAAIFAMKYQEFVRAGALYPLRHPLGRPGESDGDRLERVRKKRELEGAYSVFLREWAGDSAV